MSDIGYGTRIEMKISDTQPPREEKKEASLVAEVFDDYCSSTSLHGIGYLGAKDKSYAEKVWWILVFILSLLSCSYLITKTWIKWKTDPMIMSFEKEQIPIRDIPFPAVTICPVNKVVRENYNYTEVFRRRDNLTEEEYKKFWDISLVCNLEQYNAFFNCSLSTTDEESLDTIRSVAPDIDTISNIKWQNKYERNLFSYQITEEGVCFTFNTLSQYDMYSDLVVWWILVFILSLLSCSYLITKTWIKWKTDPMIMSFEKEQIPIRDIPFPAVTICPVNKVVRENYNYTEVFRRRDNLTEEEYKKFWDISLVCNLEQYNAFFNCSLSTTDEESLDTIRSVAPDIDTISNIKWQNKYERNLFSYQITEEGVCFTFNTLSQYDMYSDLVISKYISHEQHTTVWDIERGYKTKIRATDYPRRTTKDGISSGLSLNLISFSEHIDPVCGTPISGYKVVLHNPAEVPKAAQQYLMVPDNRKANILIKPELTKTSKSLQNLPADIRKCYFNNEKSLRFFKVYTQTNCRMECNANITMQYCDCVPFYLPHTNGTPICGYGIRDCLREVEMTIIDVEMTDKKTNMTEEDKERIEFTREIYEKCNCLPSCNSLQYNAEITHSDFHIVENILASGVYDDTIPTEIREKLRNGFLKATQVDVFFKDSEFYAFKRSEIYGRVDFLANVGGLLGLFMGFSLLSLLEIVYFSTIRIWCKYQNRRKNK